ncbi:Transcription-repair-coupling factor [Lysinibacillus sphaericus]
MRDLSIRGAGNLLGAQQHGFIDSVGFDYPITDKGHLLYWLCLHLLFLREAFNPEGSWSQLLMHKFWSKR